MAVILVPEARNGQKNVKIIFILSTKITFISVPYAEVSAKTTVKSHQELNEFREWSIHTGWQQQQGALYGEKTTTSAQTFRQFNSL